MLSGQVETGSLPHQIMGTYSLESDLIFVSCRHSDQSDNVV